MSDFGLMENAGSLKTFQAYKAENVKFEKFSRYRSK